MSEILRERENSIFYNHYKALFEAKDPIDIELGLQNRTLISSRAVSGQEYEKSNFRLMYVGRDLNGWNPLEGNNVSELVNSVLQSKAAEEFLHDAVHNPQYRDENGRITYSINRSRFWQLCREIMNQAGEKESWAERIVWSNVYKVTYGEFTVSKRLMDETYNNCLDILKAEIEFFRPNHIVFVTGVHYFLPKGLGENFEAVFSLEEDPSIFDVISKGFYTDKSGRKIKVVAVNRPDIKRGTIIEKTNKIMEAFNSI